MISFDRKGSQSGPSAQEIADKLLVIGAHLDALDAEIEDYCDTVDDLGDVRARSLDLGRLLRFNDLDFYTEGAGAPVAPGACKFAEYYDTANDKFYKYNGAAWVPLN